MANLVWKRRRQYAPKVKSGCRTCKLRHLKCDESRPGCHNCSTAGIVCEGYGIWGGGTKATEDERRRQPMPPPKRCKLPTLPAATQSLSRHNTSTPFHNLSHAERSCFDYFVNETVVKIPGVFFSHFWADLVLQASCSELPILHAAVALASAHRSAQLNLYGSAVLSSLSCCDANGNLDTHEAFALQQYNKSIAYLRACQFEEDNEAELRTALVACVLYISLELLRGDYTTAMIHARHGLNLLSKLKQDVEKQALCPKRLPETIDDYLVEAFTRLSLQSAHVGAVDALFSVFQQQKFFTDWRLPQVFPALAQARRTFDSLMQAILTLAEQCRRLEVMGTAFPEELIQQHRSLRETTSSWIRTFRASLPTLNRTTKPANMQGLSLLCIYHTMADIMVDTMLSTSERCFDEFTSAFTSIITKTIALYHNTSDTPCRQLCNDARVSGFSFTVDLGTIPPLLYVALKCRVPWLRRQAIALLLAAPHREGFWDGVIVAHNAHTVMAMEEKGFFEDFVLDLDSQPFDSPVQKNERYLHRIPKLPVTARFCHVKVVMSRLKVGMGKLVCWRRSDNSNGGWDEVVEDFDLSAADRGDPQGIYFLG
ncbi:uncharacterized protein A1O5_00524 [Cladophialophora psammophila CBS 110553]|uniref:Zn(2)-C6 fungal-type domain-containing protein n=1 Tax=Cladophialophora psammophila CBS 110553 TaxID=1182543 RepID=W9XGE5_9EURO|nr:uncharacterized protein A1O5_00524 [Cladophialophora psammophila CBS 110553]EXJ76016.1 hypothetical protein A1O5_00524 [Cladophialophora psammophila CBS 110553]